MLYPHPLQSPTRSEWNFPSAPGKLRVLSASLETDANAHTHQFIVLSLYLCALSFPQCICVCAHQTKWIKMKRKKERKCWSRENCLACFHQVRTFRRRSHTQTNQRKPDNVILYNFSWVCVTLMLFSGANIITNKNTKSRRFAAIGKYAVVLSFLTYSTWCRHQLLMCNV